MRTSTWIGLAISCSALVSSAGCYTAPAQEPPAPTGQAAVSPGWRSRSFIHEQASAFFVNDAPANAKFLRNGAWVRIKGDISDPILPTGTTATLEKIYVHGSTGDKTADELRHASNRLATVTVTGHEFDSGWIEDRDPVWTTDDVYTILEIYVTEVQGSGAPRLVESERRRQFRDIKADQPYSYVVEGVGAHQDPGTTAIVSCSGSFFNAQSVAMYDVNIEFQNVSANDQPVRIRVYAGAANPPTDCLRDESLPHGAFVGGGTWQGGPRMSSNYNGEDEMFMRVVVEYADEQTAVTDELRKFSDLVLHPAVFIPGN